MTHTHVTAPTRFAEANGTRYAYRRFGEETGVPLLFMQHFRGGLDHWDPAITDGFGRDRPVILFDNAGAASSSGETPGTVGPRVFTLPSRVTTAPCLAAARPQPKKEPHMPLAPEKSHDTQDPRYSTSGAAHVPAGEGPTTWFAGDTYTIKASRESTNGSLGLVEATVPPGGGPIAHIHTRTDEASIFSPASSRSSTGHAPSSPARAISSSSPEAPGTASRTRASTAQGCCSCSRLAATKACSGTATNHSLVIHRPSGRPSDSRHRRS